MVWFLLTLSCIISWGATDILLKKSLHYTITAPALDKTISSDIEGVKKLVIDFKSLEFISSAGLRVLLGAQKKMQKVGTMKLVNVCEDVMEVFEMTGFSDILTIE